jgi:hypothetical protein
MAPDPDLTILSKTRGNFRKTVTAVDFYLPYALTCFDSHYSKFYF